MLALHFMLCRSLDPAGAMLYLYKEITGKVNQSQVVS